MNDLPNHDCFSDEPTCEQERRIHGCIKLAALTVVLIAAVVAGVVL